MRIWIFFFIIFSAFACQESEPTLNSGKAIALATDGEIRDTLNTCYCWQTKDSLNFHITNEMSFYGISVDVISKNNIYETSLQYYSDTNEFDGEFNLNVPIASDSLTISFENMKDSIRITGYFQLKSEPVKFYRNGRTIETTGSFNCTMARK